MFDNIKSMSYNEIADKLKELEEVFDKLARRQVELADAAIRGKNVYNSDKSSARMLYECMVQVEECETQINALKNQLNTSMLQRR